MPYLVITVYNKNYGEILEPYIFQLGNKIKLYQLRPEYIDTINEIKNDLMEDYNDCEFNDIYEMTEYIINKIDKL